MKKMYRAILALLCLGFVFTAMPVYADNHQSTELPERIKSVTTPPDQDDLIEESEAGVLFGGVTRVCWYAGTCNLCDAMAVMVNVANIILRVFAIIGVVFMLYGAIFIVLSQGSSERLKKGKDVMQAAIVGGILVLGAWQMVALLGFVIMRSQSANTSRLTYNPFTSWYTLVDQCRDSVKPGQAGNFLPQEALAPNSGQ